jgi:uric acid-xanthine permease
MSTSVSSPIVKDQPTPTPLPIASHSEEALANEKATGSFFRREAGHVKRKFTTRQGWLGDYDYAWYAIPMKLTFFSFLTI